MGGQCGVWIGMDACKGISPEMFLLLPALHSPSGHTLYSVAFWKGQGNRDRGQWSQGRKEEPGK